MFQLIIKRLQVGRVRLPSQVDGGPSLSLVQARWYHLQQYKDTVELLDYKLLVLQMYVLDQSMVHAVAI